ncbi:MAG: LLM class F420-dependent oxidoreductase [Acidimicrobiales bacterium]|nr:LLM class F420-dependent oxidoreductase [Acidimicrobiales bacterium]
MKAGITYFPTATAISPGELASAMEQRGFESLWVAEHSHIPASRQTPWPGGAELPQMYYETYDPFVALMAAAAATTTLKLGTGICLVPQRDPIHTAKQVASLDQLSRGRFLFGIGAGWNEEEMRNHGTEPQGRFKLMREKIAAMKAIWADNPAEYHGDLVDFDSIYMLPKPLQSPHPPIHVGGSYPGGARRAAQWGDGWIPIGARLDGDLGAMIAEMRQVAADAGRDPAAIEVTMYAPPEDAATLQGFAEAGVDRVVFGMAPVPSGPAIESIERSMDAFTEAGVR